MEAKIYYKNKKITSFSKKQRSIYAKLENGEEVLREELVKPNFTIQCEECGHNNSINYYHKRECKKYICFSCRTKGERNPFYGKVHTEEVRKTISDKRIGKPNPMKGKKMQGAALQNIRNAMSILKSKGTNVGKNNPFYGKKHPKELMDLIVKKKRDTISKWSDEKKLEISKKLSEVNKRYYNRDPKKYIENKKTAGSASHFSQRKYKKNRIEEIVERKFSELGLYPKYSVILGRYQYDFGFKESRILLEVQGDYWHGNPRLFDVNGVDGKRILNDIQIKKIRLDEDKKKFAIDNNLKIYYIWEKDINEGNFKILDDIKNEIQNKKT